MKYRKKPIIVEAEQWLRGTCPKGLTIVRETEEIAADCSRWPPYAFVTTIHGQRTSVELGDWIITEPDGVHHYPCKPDIFAATYEPVDP